MIIKGRAAALAATRPPDLTSRLGAKSAADDSSRSAQPRDVGRDAQPSGSRRDPVPGSSRSNSKGAPSHRLEVHTAIHALGSKSAPIEINEDDLVRKIHPLPKRPKPPSKVPSRHLSPVPINSTEPHQPIKKKKRRKKNPVGEAEPGPASPISVSSTSPSPVILTDLGLPEVDGHQRSISPSERLFMEDPNPNEIPDALKLDPGFSGMITIDGLTLPVHIRIASNESEVIKSDSDEGSDIAEKSDQDEGPSVKRYFFPDENKSVICAICTEEGHTQKDCRRQYCYSCGVLDQHESRNCPILVTCFRCGEKGHIRDECRNRVTSASCALCGERSHLTKNCHTVWRRYNYFLREERDELLADRKRLQDLPFLEGGENYIAPTIWCFTCGAQGHWGYDCRSIENVLYRKGPPAFSNSNLNTGPHRNARRYVSNDIGPIAHTKLSNQMDSFADGAGFVAPSEPGMQARKKRRKELEDVHGMGRQGDDDEDWFAKPKGRSLLDRIDTGKGKGKDREPVRVEYRDRRKRQDDDDRGPPQRYDTNGRNDDRNRYRRPRSRSRSPFEEDSRYASTFKGGGRDRARTRTRTRSSSPPRHRPPPMDRDDRNGGSRRRR